MIIGVVDNGGRIGPGTICGGLPLAGGDCAKDNAGSVNATSGASMNANTVLRQWRDLTCMGWMTSGAVIRWCPRGATGRGFEPNRGHYMWSRHRSEICAM
jgi:hypothetical protein